MDYMDEETLVWDQKDNQFVAKDEQDLSVLWRSVSPNQSHTEFLRHFDKAENQLINISSELLAITLKVNSLAEPDDITTLRFQLANAINDIKAKATDLSYPIAVIDKLCFLYAVVLDEFIIYTEWGEKQGWENKTLLSELFGMRNGGELFFTVAEKASRQPHKMIDLLEVIYLFLSVGFKGQYRETGSEQLKRFTHQLEQILSQYRQPSALYSHTKVTMPKVRKPTRKKRYALTTLLFSGLIGLILSLTYFWYQKSEPQRAKDFVQLSEYSQRYIETGHAEEIVYLSDDSDIKGHEQLANVAASESSTTDPVSTTLNTGDQSLPWIVQLATFSAKQNAEKFLNNLPKSDYQPSVDQSGNYFRVIIRSNSLQSAKTIKTWYQNQSNVSAIIVRSQREGAAL